MKKVILLISVLVSGIASFAAVGSTKCHDGSVSCPDVQNVEVCNKKDDVIKVIKELYYATANGDVAKIKKLTTPDFYKEQYPYSDEFLRKELLSVPYKRRQDLITHIDKNSDFTVVFSTPGDYATVWIDDRVTGKNMRYGLLYDFDDNCWRICDYEY